MGLIKKKAKKVDAPPRAPVASFEAVMHNTTTLTADEEGEYCHATFQTDKVITSAVWEALAQHARKGARFMISVLPDGEGKNND